MQNPEDPSDVLDGALLVRFHEDGNVAAVWDGTDTLSLHTVWDGSWYQTDSRDVSGQSKDQVDTIITSTFG